MHLIFKVNSVLMPKLCISLHFLCCETESDWRHLSSANIDIEVGNLMMCTQSVGTVSTVEVFMVEVRV